MISMLVGSRPWLVWNCLDSSAVRASIAARRLDQCVISSLDIPSISRTARLPRPRKVSTNRTPRAAIMWASRRVLYSSEAATVTRCRGWPSSASQRRVPLASTWQTLLETATWVCRSGSPARESRCVNAAAIRPSVSTWATPLAPMRVKVA